MQESGIPSAAGGGKHVIASVQRKKAVIGGGLLILLTLSASVRAASVVYRIDTRDILVLKALGGILPPVLRQGQTADDDLVHHVEGPSLLNRTSPFVSTTASLPEAIRLAAALSQVYKDAPYASDVRYYIYMIRADENVYDVEASLRYAIRQQTAHDPQRLARLTALVNEGGTRHQFVAHGGIAFERIMKTGVLTGGLLTLYGVEDDSPLLTDPFWQDRFDDAGTTYHHVFDGDHSSTAPYPSTRIATPTGFITGALRGGGQVLVPLGMTCAGAAYHESACPVLDKHNYQRIIVDKTLAGVMTLNEQL